MNIDLQEIIDSYIKKNIEARLYNKRGGAAYDYANFCVYDDFIWLKEEIKSDFNWLKRYIIEDIEEELDIETEEAKELLEDFEVENYIYRYKEDLLSRAGEMAENVGTHKIYDHIVNQIEEMKVEVKEAFERLEEALIEKGVVSDLEELKEIKSYQKAKAYVESKSEPKTDSLDKEEDNKTMKELIDLISSNEGEKFIKKKINRALQAKQITKETESILLKKLKDRISIKEKEEKNRSKEVEEKARQKIKAHNKYIEDRKNINYDLAIEGYEPNLDLEEFLSHFNAKYFSLQHITKISEINKNTLKEYKMALAEDYMFTEESIKTIKQYTSLINEIGAVLPISVESQISEETLKRFYNQNMKFYLHIFINYKLLWIDKIEKNWINKAFDYIELTKELIPDFVRKEESIFSIYIEKHLFPHYVIPLATNEGNKLFEQCKEGKINSKTIFALGLENTKQSELSDEYIIEKVNEMLEIRF